VPTLWAAATGRGITTPDWTARGRPHHCHLGEEDYAALLRDRATGTMIEARDGHAVASGPDGGVLVTWRGAHYDRTPMARGEATAAFPEGSPGSDHGAAVFTWRGDFHVTGWLSAYLRTHP
jgi:helicase